MHGHHGKVVSIDTHHGGKHAVVTVRHGKRKRMKDGPGGSDGGLASFDQPESRIVMPKAHAANYRLGQTVQAGVDAQAETESDDLEGKAPPIGMPRKTVPPPRKKGPSKERLAKGKARFTQAMKKRR